MIIDMTIIFFCDPLQYYISKRGTLVYMVTRYMWVITTILKPSAETLKQSKMHHIHELLYKPNSQVKNAFRNLRYLIITILCLHSGSQSINQVK